MADTTYQAKIHRSGPDQIDVESGGKITNAGTQASHLTDMKTDYTSGDFDSDAEIIVAINLINVRINALMAALEGVGILASS